MQEIVSQELRFHRKGADNSNHIGNCYKQWYVKFNSQQQLSSLFMIYIPTAAEGQHSGILKLDQTKLYYCSNE